MDTTVALIIALFFATSAILASIAPSIADSAHLMLWSKPGAQGWTGSPDDGRALARGTPRAVLAKAAGGEQGIGERPLPHVEDHRKAAILKEIFSHAQEPRHETAGPARGEQDKAPA